MTKGKQLFKYFIVKLIFKQIFKFYFLQKIEEIFMLPKSCFPFKQKTLNAPQETFLFRVGMKKSQSD